MSRKCGEVYCGGKVMDCINEMEKDVVGVVLLKGGEDWKSRKRVFEDMCGKGF